jgi:RNA polymerase sigma-70 factor, ECF subfamily
MTAEPRQPDPAITRLLSSASAGDRRATDELLPLVYDELRTLAAQHLAEERAGHTLQPTALAHEAYLRLLGPGGTTWENRAHFFGAAARAIRRILVDHARTRGREKRGGGMEFEVLQEDSAKATERSDIDLLALDEAMERLALLDPQKALLVELRFFGGLTLKEVAAAMEISESTVVREWQFARVWLYRELGGGSR